MDLPQPPPTLLATLTPDSAGGEGRRSAESCWGGKGVLLGQGSLRTECTHRSPSPTHSSPAGGSTENTRIRSGFLPFPQLHQEIDRPPC